MAAFEHNSAQFGYIDLDDLLGVQKALAKLGFDPGKLDGIDGPNTEKAVRAFQAHALIDVDGKVGKGTRQALVTELQTKAQGATPTTT
ncbi:MAG: peptidoglycan-binding domain-containing protein [Deltaproteobacteria bacterium]